MSLALLGAGTAARAFSPADVAGLAAWYKADAITGKADGDAVAQWNDSSGSARHLAQAVGANQPTYQTAEVNGRPVVRFDGANDSMQAIFALTQPVTVFLVFKALDATVNEYLLDGAAAVLTMGLYRASATQYQQYAGGFGATLNSPDFQTGFHIGTLVYNGAGSRAVVDSTVSPQTGNAGAGVPGGITLAATADGANQVAADLAEVIVYAVDVSAPNCVSVEAYLRAKYATP